MKTVRRGYDDKDEQLFSDAQRGKILSAAEDARWLMNRGYSADSAITFTSNHYLLSSRQRMAIFRSILSDEDRRERKARELQAPGREVLIDGLNTIITLETALSDSVVLCGDDGVMRDVAGLHGTYRIIDKTPQAIDMILASLMEWNVRKATFLLDKPVSNSGALRQLILERSEGSPVDVAVELDANPDVVLIMSQHTDR